MSEISMKRLAELAGLDISTVSRALRGDNKRVAAATIDRVRKLAAETGFTPDHTAATLRGGRSRLIGVVIHSLTDAVAGTLITAIDKTAHERGYMTLVVATQDDPNTRNEAIRTLLGRRVDGFILCDSLIGNEVPDQLVSTDVPFVFAMRGCSDRVSVRADDLMGGRLVAQHFIETGHRHIALIPGPARARTAVERGEGFASVVDGHSDANLYLSPGPGGYTFEDGYRAMKRLLSNQNRPTAVFGTNDHTAVGACRALTEAGLQVGTDVAVCGYNDLEMARYLPTPLSSVQTNIPGIGQAATVRLMDLLQGKPALSTSLAPELIVRESSGLFARALTSS